MLEHLRDRKFPLRDPVVYHNSPVSLMGFPLDQPMNCGKIDWGSPSPLMTINNDCRFLIAINAIDILT